jgi:hypothetical protein
VLGACSAVVVAAKTSQSQGKPSQDKTRQQQHKTREGKEKSSKIVQTNTFPLAQPIQFESVA